MAAALIVSIAVIGIALVVALFALVIFPLRVMFAAAFKIRRFNRVYDHEVVGVGQGRVILRSRRRKRRRDARSRSRVRRVPRGFLYGLEWEGGYAHVRRLDTPGADSEFELIPVSGELRVGDLVRLYPCAFPRDPFVAHGMQFEEVRLQGELAPIPAWYVPGERDRPGSSSCTARVRGGAKRSG